MLPFISRPVDQASADNASAVGLMAESFAKKGWEFALKQDQSIDSTSTSIPHTPHAGSPMANTKRSYSTLTPVTFTGSHGCSVSVRRMLSSTAAVGEIPIALMTRDVINFPPRLRELRTRLLEFMEEVVCPAERTLMDHQMSQDRWQPHPLVEEMKVSHDCTVGHL